MFDFLSPKQVGKCTEKYPFIFLSVPYRLILFIGLNDRQTPTVHITYSNGLFFLQELCSSFGTFCLMWHYYKLIWKRIYTCTLWRCTLLYKFHDEQIYKQQEALQFQAVCIWKFNTFSFHLNGVVSLKKIYHLVAWEKELLKLFSVKHFNYVSLVDWTILFLSPLLTFVEYFSCFVI